MFSKALFYRIPRTQDCLVNSLTVSQTRSFDSLEMKDFEEYNFKLGGNGKKFSKRVKKHYGKRRNCSLRAIPPFSHSVFKRLVLQTCENQDLFGKGLISIIHLCSILCGKTFFVETKVYAICQGPISMSHFRKDGHLGWH